MVRKENRYQVKENIDGDLEYLTFPLLQNIEGISHLFTTRKGGVSKGFFASMNLSFQRGDEDSCVRENFRRIAVTLHTTPDRMVCARQTHTTNIRIVTEADCGKGVTKLADYDDVDGLITSEPGIVLCTSFADCVPLYFVDPVKRVIGLAHSGWKGTVNRIGEHMVHTMENRFDCDPSHLLAVIGPSICVDCYEVGEDVAKEFRRAFLDPEILHKGRTEGKYQLDLWRANKQILMDSGITEDHLEITDVCTCCNPELLFSHRASHGKRGNLGAFLSITH